jgi:thiol-disulfide isomerase/thioredoxin
MMISMGGVLATAELCKHLGLGQMETMAAQFFVVMFIAPRLAAILFPAKSITGEQSPSITGLTYVQGEEVKLGEGKPAVVEFWATWCPPCKASIPHLNELFTKYQDRGMQFVGITREGEDKVGPFITSMAGKFSVRCLPPC